VADFVRLKLAFIQKSIFESLFRGLRGNVGTLSIACWKTRDRLVIGHDWIFCYILRSRSYKRKSVEVGVFRKVSQFERKFQTEGGVDC